MRLTRQMSRTYGASQVTSLILGVLLTLGGLISFFQQPLFGVYAVNLGNSLIYLATGVIGLFAAAGDEIVARRFLQIAGIVYAFIAIIGIIQGNTMLGIMAINAADNWMHSIIAVVMLWFGYYPEAKEQL